MPGFIWQAYAKVASFDAAPFESLVDESTASQLRKIYIRELALISQIRQLLAPFSAEGGIRLPRYRVMRQQCI